MPNYYRLASNVLKKSRSVAKRAVKKQAFRATEVADYGGSQLAERSMKRSVRYPLQRHVHKKPPAKAEWKPEGFPGQTQESGISRRLYRKLYKAERPRVGPKDHEEARLRKPLMSKATGKSNPKPKMQLTQKQWQMMMERVFRREQPVQVSAMQNPVEGIMGLEPPSTRLYGRIKEPIMEGGERVGFQPRDYPYAEAQMRYLKMPPGQRKGLGSEEYIPPSDVLSFEGGKPSYERRVYRPVKEPAQRAEQAAQEVAQPSLEERGKKVIDSVRGVQAKGRSGRTVSTVQAPAEELVKQAMLGDKMWKFIGGKRTLTGKLWDRYRANHPGGKKVPDARDYFIRQFLIWADDAKAYSSKFPERAKSLQSIWDEFTQAAGGELT